MELIKIPDRETGGWEIEVERQIGHVSSEWGDPDEDRETPRPRWSVNTVWRLSGPRWALYRASMSVIYHTADTECRVMGPEGPGTGAQRGTLCKAKEMPDTADPCPRCRPTEPEWLPDDAMVRFEFPRQRVEIFEDPARLSKRLVTYRKISGDEVAYLSGPARALLAQCRENDDDFAAARLQVMRIS